jgi:hypothetical protein
MVSLQYPQIPRGDGKISCALARHVRELQKKIVMKKNIKDNMSFIL